MSELNKSFYDRTSLIRALLFTYQIKQYKLKLYWVRALFIVLVRWPVYMPACKHIYRLPRSQSDRRILPVPSPFCWFHIPSIISAASNVVFWTFLRAKTCCVVCHTCCFCYGGTDMARKMVWKTTFHLTWDDSTLTNQGAGKQQKSLGRSVHRANNLFKTNFGTLYQSLMLKSSVNACLAF